MDRLLTCEVKENKIEWELIKDKMLDLVDIYYEALDAPKTGNKVVSNAGFIQTLTQTLSFSVLCYFNYINSKKVHTMQISQPLMEFT
jgi:RNA-dependent RNA polymerase